MKKTLLLLSLMVAFAMSSMAQSNNVPKPLNPEVEDWMDFTPNENGGILFYFTEMQIQWGMDVMGNLVADDYSIDIDTCFTPGPCQYTMLDPDKFSFSIYTDHNKLYTFTPEKYEEFTEPTTDVPFSVTRLTEDGGTNPHFEPWFVHFEDTNEGAELGLPRFFKWRIGVQTHYTVDGVTNSSDIVYWDVNKWGDVNNDQKVDVNDITIIINMILNNVEKDSIADINDDGKIDVNDVTLLINRILNKVADFGDPVTPTE
jgi:hypothetical protein